MSFPDLVPALSSKMPELRGRLTPNASMAELTWLRVGGPAQVLFNPADEDDLAYFLAELPSELAITVVGVGSNLLVRDGGVEGVVIRLGGRVLGDIAVVDEGRIQAGAAALDQRVAKAAADAGIGSLAFYAGIPGSIGGALRMNAGAHGGETKDVLVYANAVTRDGDFVTLTNAEMGFTYRHTAAPEDLIFTSALFQGTASTPEAERAAIEHVQKTREVTQPIKTRTGGSTFKNPPGSSSWKVIDAAGLRGFRVGGAHMSEMHTNFLINDQSATARDVELLGETVRQRVFEHSGVKLEWEIKRIGKFAPGQEVAPAF
jgi:UDP-N-acetylmuramate dehydrogenase